MNFPRHNASLHLTHNQHKAYYERVEETYRDDKCWISSEQKAKAIETQDVWEIQWYPDTPIGSYVLLAADLSLLLEAALKVEA